MAVYYYLAVACADQSAADAVTAYYDGILLRLAAGVSFRCRTTTIQDWEGAWWSTTRPYGASINALDTDGRPEPNLATDEQRIEIGRHLYQHLRNAPAFRYAMYGAEALDHFFDAQSTYNIVLRNPELLGKGWQGLVIDHSLWEQGGSSNNYETFRPGYLWRPYAGRSIGKKNER